MIVIKDRPALLSIHFVPSFFSYIQITIHCRFLPGGRGRSGWAAARGWAGRWSGCGACPWLGFAARGRCGPPPGFLRGRIYFRQGLGEGRRRRRRGACPRRGGRHGMASLRGLPLAESALRAAAAARPTAGRFQRIFGEMFGARNVRQQGAPRDCQEWCASHMFLNGQRLQGRPPIECSV